MPTLAPINMKKLIPFVFVALLITCCQKTFNRVADYENVLSQAEIDSLNDLYRAHEDLTSNQFLLITTPDIGDADNILAFATQKGNELGVGQKELDNGIIIVYSGALKETSIATGLGMELILTDSIAQFVIDTQMIPLFKEGKTFKGLYTGSKWIADFLEKPENKINGANKK